VDAAVTVAPHFVGISVPVDAGWPITRLFRQLDLGDAVPNADFNQHTGPAWPLQFPGAKT
jgi:hypothetical protein